MYKKAYPFRSLVYTVISLQIAQSHVFSVKFAFWDIRSTGPFISYNVTCCITIIGPFSHAYIENTVDILVLALRLLALREVLHNSCNMGTCDLPEMYARSPWAVPSDFGHTFQANHSCPCYKYKVSHCKMYYMS